MSVFSFPRKKPSVFLVDSIRLDGHLIRFGVEQNDGTTSGVQFFAITRENFAEVQARVIELITDEVAPPANANSNPRGAA